MVDNEKLLEEPGGEGVLDVPTVTTDNGTVSLFPRFLILSHEGRPIENTKDIADYNPHEDKSPPETNN